MPSLDHLIFLREKYGKSENLLKAFDTKMLSESFRHDKYQGLSGFDIESREFSFDGEKLVSIKNIFDTRKKVNVVTLFIDMANFSIRFEKFNNDRLSKVLDQYYDLVIPIIYKYGGEVEKLIGDGIICVFGEPFLAEGIVDLHKIAEDCAKEIIVTTKRNNLESKIALHSGEIMYYKPTTGDFKEYTMIGKSLTELFRLESISINNSINYYCSSLFDRLIDYDNMIPVYDFNNHLFDWVYVSPKDISLVGVTYTQMRYIKYNQ